MWGPTPLKKLRQATDLPLRATKETACAIGRSMVATERHLLLNLSGIKEKDKTFLLDALLSPPGLFGDAVSLVTERFQEAKKQYLCLSSVSEVHLSSPQVPRGCCQGAAQALYVGLLIPTTAIGECFSPQLYMVLWQK